MSVYDFLEMKFKTNPLTKEDPPCMLQLPFFSRETSTNQFIWVWKEPSICKLTLPLHRKMRRHGWQFPLHPLQVCIFPTPTPNKTKKETKNLRWGYIFFPLNEAASSKITSFWSMIAGVCGNPCAKLWILLFQSEISLESSGKIMVLEGTFFFFYVMKLCYDLFLWIWDGIRLRWRWWWW